MNILVLSQFASLKRPQGRTLATDAEFKRFWHKSMNTIYSTFFNVITLLADFSNRNTFSV